jgi:predicted aldo/keto reductase-like oxidoreductase
MRPLTSGIFPRLVGALAPEWQAAKDVWKVALAFVLSDSRVHVANVGMRWPVEVDRNVDLAESMKSVADMADLPRWTIDVYRATDREAGL